MKQPIHAASTWFPVRNGGVTLRLVRSEGDLEAGDGRDPSFAAVHLGPLAFTEARIPALADGTNVVFIASAVEDPEREPAVRVGFRGARSSRA